MTAAGRFSGLVGSRILAIADEVRALQAGGRQICNLSIGDFDPHEFPIPRPLLERIEGALRRGETNYPPSAGIPALREQVSALYAREFGLSIPAGSIVVTGGARPGLFAAYQLTVDENHHMLPDASLLIKNVSTSSFVLLKVPVEYLSQCRSRDFTRGTLHVPLDVPSKSNRCHMKLASPSVAAVCDRVNKLESSQ